MSTSSTTNFFQPIGKKVDQITSITNGNSHNDGYNNNGDNDNGDNDQPVSEIESLCMNCHENGITRLLLTSIPYFREVVIMSFSCQHCGFANNEMQSAGTIQPKGSWYELRPTTMDDLNRQIIKSDTATVKFIELDLEAPPGKGQMTNVEGLLRNIVDDLEVGQEARRKATPEVFAKIELVLAKSRAMLAGDSFPFRLRVDDPTGNSFITPDLKDGVGKWEKHEYERTPEQNAALGLSGADADATDGTQPGAQAGFSKDDNDDDNDDDDEILVDQIYSFPATCPGCTHPCTSNMKMVDIPHFKQVVLMSVVCVDCGYRSNEVKTGGEIPERGERLTLRVENQTDLSRDILKSETCALECPELELSVTAGTMGGRFTTIEGLLTQVRDDLRRQIFQIDDVVADPSSAEGGDSLQAGERARWAAFFAGLDEAIRGDKKFTVILSDPLASSFVQALVDPPEPDPQITRVSYERTDEEEEELGLKDMKVEGYEEEDEAGQATEAGTDGVVEV